MDKISPTTINLPSSANPESPPVASAEARTVAPLLVSGIESVARSRLQVVFGGSLLVDVAALLSSAQISVVVVCDAEGAAMGVITETVLVARLGLGQADFFTTRASDVMTRDFTVCAPEDLLSEVLAMMHTHGLIHVLLVDIGRKPLGVLNARDGLRALLSAGNHEEALLRNYVMGIGYQ
jgi:CBS domain-containing protein